MRIFYDENKNWQEWSIIAIVILLIAFAMFLNNSIYAQTWKGDNRADYNANDICADNYLLHIPGRTFPDTSISYCCADTIGSYTGLISFFDSLSGDTIIININLGSDTIYIIDEALGVSDTIYSIDTVLVLGSGNNGLRFSTHNEYICDTILTGIDTLSDPYDSIYCSFCDSIMIANWFTVSRNGDTLSYDLWRVETGIDKDSCGILGEYGYTNGSITYINYQVFGDTIIYHIHEENSYYGCGWWAFDSMSGSYHFIDCGDTINLTKYNSSTIADRGVWVKDCTCDTTYTFTSDSIVPFLSIDNSWKAYYGNTRRTTSPAVAISLIENVTLGGDFAIQASSEYHNGYMHAVQDSILALYGGHSILIGDSYLYGVYDFVPVDSLLFPNYAANPESLWSLWTRNIDHNYFDTLESYGNTYIPPVLDYIPPNEGLANWINGSMMPRAISHWIPAMGSAYDHKAISIRFEKTVDLRNLFDSRDIDLFQAVQPAWNIVTASDDFMPYISINGFKHQLDTIQADSYSANVYTIHPTAIDYTRPIKITTGVHSYASAIIGANMILAIEYPESDSIPECVWKLKDSLIVPPCSLLVSCHDSTDTVIWYLGQSNVIPDCYGDCADTICFKWLQGVNPYGWFSNGGDIVQCFSVCDIDTIDWSGVEYGVAPMDFGLIVLSSDSLDTFTIKAYSDSIVLSDDDDDPIIINSSGGLRTSGNMRIGSGMRLEIADSSDSSIAYIFNDGDTIRFNADNPIQIADNAITVSNDSVIVNGYFKADSLKLYNLETKVLKADSTIITDIRPIYGDSIITIRDNVLGWTLADSISGSSLASYDENGTFSTGPSATGTNSIAIGYDASAGNPNAIAIGYSNTASWARAAVFGGQNNTSSAESAIICGGSSHSITGNYAGIFGGQSNSISGINSGIVSGANNSISGSYSFAFGNNVDIFTNYQFAIFDSVNTGKFTINCDDSDTAKFALQVNGGVFLEDSLKLGPDGIQIYSIEKIGSFISIISSSDTFWIAADSSGL